MPIYAYRCGNCGFEQDVIQKMSAEPLTTCPKCHAESFSKQLTAPGFQLKGSGWYATDFKGGAKPSAGSAKSDSGDSAKSDSKSDSTPSASASSCPGGACACH